MILHTNDLIYHDQSHFRMFYETLDRYPAPITKRGGGISSFRQQTAQKDKNDNEQKHTYRSSPRSPYPPTPTPSVPKKPSGKGNKSDVRVKRLANVSKHQQK